MKGGKDGGGRPRENALLLKSDTKKKKKHSDFFETIEKFIQFIKSKVLLQTFNA